MREDEQGPQQPPEPQRCQGPCRSPHLEAPLLSSGQMKPYLKLRRQNRKVVHGPRGSISTLAQSHWALQRFSDDVYCASVNSSSGLWLPGYQLALQLCDLGQLPYSCLCPVPHCPLGPSVALPLWWQCVVAVAVPGTLSSLPEPFHLLHHTHRDTSPKLSLINI